MKSFYEYAFMFYDEKYGISRVDWYNAIQDMLKEDKIYNEQSFDIRHRVLGWYEYELVVKSKEYVVNEVIAPLFPSFDESYEPTMYTFTYLLSPASTWKDFSNLNIKIVTDAYILNTTLGKVERVEDGTYQFHLDKLPEGEFVFEVSTALNPKKIITGFYVFYMIIEILTILFCISPFGIILLILYFIRRKNSSKEQKKLKRYYGIEASLSILMMIFGFLSLFSYYISGIAATGILCCLGILLCLIVECVKQNRIMFIRIFLTIATLLSYSFCFVDLSTLQENFKMVGMVSIIFGILLYISIIVTLLNLNKQISHQEKTVIKPNEFYPIGYLNGKWKLVLNIFLGIWFLSLSIGLAILIYKEESFLLLFVIYFILFIIFIIFYIFGMILKNEKDFMQFNKDLNYEKLEKNNLKKLKDSRIHPETKNYYLIKLSNACIAYSLEKYYALQKEIFLPQNKSYRLLYETSKLNFLLTQDQMQRKAKQLILKYPKNLVLKRSILRYTLKWKAYFDGDIMDSIQQLAPYQTKNEYNNAFHLYIQIYYYKHRNDLQKSKELKALFLKKYGELKVLADELNFGINYREEVMHHESS